MSQEEIKVINDRLKELGKEYQDLTALKKKILSANAHETIKEKYGDYKYLVKSKENKEIDFDKMIDENDIKFKKSAYGMMAALYSVGPNQVSYHVAKTEEECDQVRIVESLFNIGDKVAEVVKDKGALLTAQEILEMYDGARAGQQLEESEESEEVSE